MSISSVKLNNELAISQLQEAANIIRARDDILQKAQDEAQAIRKDAEEKAQALVVYQDNRRKLCNDRCDEFERDHKAITAKWREDVRQATAEAIEEELRFSNECLSEAKTKEEEAKKRLEEARQIQAEARKRLEEIQQKEDEAKKRIEQAQKREAQANDQCVMARDLLANARMTVNAIEREGQQLAERARARAVAILSQAKTQASAAVLQRSNKEIGAKLLQLETDRDVVIRCRDQREVHVHRLVLQTYPYFSTKLTFEGNVNRLNTISSEKQKKDSAAHTALVRATTSVLSTQSQGSLSPTAFDFPDHSEEAVQQLMKYLYTGSTDSVPPGIIIELYQLAELLLLDELVAQCLKALTQLVDEVPDLLNELHVPRNINDYSKLDARYCEAFIKHRSPGSLDAGQLKLFKEVIAPILVVSLERDRKRQFDDRERREVIENMETFWRSNQLPPRTNLRSHSRTIEVFMNPFLTQYNVPDAVWQRAMISYLSNNACIPSNFPIRDKLAICQAAIDSNLIDTDFGYACLRAFHNTDDLSPDTTVNQIMEYFTIPESDRNPILANLLMSYGNWASCTRDSKKQEFYKFLNSQPPSFEIRYLLALCKLDGIVVRVDREAALKEFRQLYEENYLFAFYILGFIEETNLVPSLGPQDFVRVFENYQKGVEKGCMLAQREIAWLYLRGLGARTNIPFGLSQLECSAKRGRFTSLADLADIYQKGLYGQAINEGKAFTYMKRAAEFRNQYAMLPLSKFYETGYSGIPVNMELALKWAQHAHEFGITEAAQEVERLSKIVGLLA